MCICPFSTGKISIDVPSQPCHKHNHRKRTKQSFTKDTKDTKDTKKMPRKKKELEPGDVTMSEMPEVMEMPVELVEAENVVVPTVPKRPKKLEKDLTSQPGKVIITVRDGTGPMVFDCDELPEEIRKHFVPFGVGHKLGDAAAAAESPVEAEAFVQKVWEALKKGEWVIRRPAAPKVSLADVATNFKNLSEEEREAAAVLLKALNIKIPGIS